MGEQVRRRRLLEIEGVPLVDHPHNLRQPFPVPPFLQPVHRRHDGLVRLLSQLCHLLHRRIRKDPHVHPVVECFCHGLQGHPVVRHSQMHAVHEAGPELTFQRRHGIGKVHLVELPWNFCLFRHRPLDREVPLWWNRYWLGWSVFSHDQILLSLLVSRVTSC